MPHQYNRSAFKSLAAGSNILVSLYCSLVALEVGIKDHFSGTTWRAGHRLEDWVSELGEAALAVQLANGLAVLKCTDKRGNVASVAANSYPDLRYLRHMTDFVGTSTDAQINDALQIVTDIISALKARGVTL